jgi:hypothetical protein
VDADALAMGAGGRALVGEEEPLACHGRRLPILDRRARRRRPRDEAGRLEDLGEHVESLAELGEDQDLLAGPGEDLLDELEKGDDLGFLPPLDPSGAGDEVGL